MKRLLIVWLLLVSGTSPASTSNPNKQDPATLSTTQTATKNAAHLVKTRTAPRSAAAKLLPKTKRHQHQLLINHVVDDSDDDDFDEIDFHVGYRRPELIPDADTDELSDYVIVRLAVARARAMARFREINNC